MKGSLSEMMLNVFSAPVAKKGEEAGLSLGRI
jgi:hypothetical protein